MTEYQFEDLENIGLIHENCGNERHKKWQLENKETALFAGDYVQARFIEAGKDGAEWMWLLLSTVDGDLLTGTLENDPVFVTKLRCGDTIIINRAEVCALLRANESSPDDHT